jgi:hypothetical protein
MLPREPLRRLRARRAAHVRRHEFRTGEFAIRHDGRQSFRIPRSAFRIPPAGIQLLAGCLALLGLAAPSAAQPPPQAHAAHDVIEGPAPVPPDVMVRDGQGRVTVRAVRIEEPLRIDGVLDERVYERSLPIGDFIQQEPQEGEPATEQTHVWIFYDRDHLYVAARCYDSQPHRIVANDMRRDGRNVGANDNLSVVLDTFLDRRNGYEFLVNAVGGMVDVQITDERNTNRDWNTVWVSRSRIDEHGWTVEMAIPFRSLRYRAGGPQVWGINIRRTVRWKNEFSYLSPVPRVLGVRGILQLSSAATLVGLDAPATSLNIEVKPYALSSARADRAIDPALRTDFDGDAGFDVKYGLTRGLTADFTFRTDFAQVEDDDQQVNLTRFSEFYPEKREFFLEGQGIFTFGGVDSAPTGGRTPTTPANTPLLFFSRRIGLSGAQAVPIDVGGRLTGKAGRYSVGLLQIQTGESAAAGVPSMNFGVVRLKRDILRRSYIGLIGTRRAASGTADGADLAFGLDAGLSFFENLNIIGYYARTRTPGVTGREESHRARFDYNGDLFGLQVERLAVGEHFRPEVGFLRRSDFIQHAAQVRLSRRPAWWPSVRKVNVEAALDYITDSRQRLENRLARVALRTELQSGDSWTVESERHFEFLPRLFPIAPGIDVPVGAYHFSNVRGNYSLGSQRRITGDLSAAHGGFYAGHRTDLGYRGRVELTPRLSLEPGVSVNRVDLPEGRFTAKLLSTRTTLAFSPSIVVAALVQYNSRARLMSTNVRFRWEYRPGSDLFVVYTDGRDPLLRGPHGLMNRSAAIKFTRLFRL